MGLKGAVLFVLLAFLFLFLTCACGPIADTRILDFSDVHPPVFVDLETRDGTTLVLTFTKPAEIISLNSVPSLSLASDTPEDNSIILSFSEAQIPGIEYMLEISVRDEKNNSMDLVTRFYGYNPDVPGLLINEFTTQGTGNHPDVVELWVTRPGNLAGVAFFEGTRNIWQNKMVFPGLQVKEGDYVLVHCKPQGIPGEINETELPAASGGLDASPRAWDFWLAGGTGLSGNNGVLTVYSNPHGEILDGVLYSNRTSASDEDYRGFGSADTMEKADELAEAGAWIAGGELVAPEDAVNPENSTSTRSICRSSQSIDTNTAADWHIVPTSGFTFGGQNSDDVYIPK